MLCPANGTTPANAGAGVCGGEDAPAELRRAAAAIMDKIIWRDTFEGDYRGGYSFWNYIYRRLLGMAAAYEARLAKEAAAQCPPALAFGDRVRHATFGEGVVVELRAPALTSDPNQPTVFVAYPTGHRGWHRPGALVKVVAAPGTAG